MNTFSTNFLAGATGMRWIGDVHGSLAVDYAIDSALAEGMKIGFIGDLTDQPERDNSGVANDSAHTLRRAFNLVRSGDAVLVPGNHCAKLFRYFLKRSAGNGEESSIKLSHGLDKTIEEILTSDDADDLIDGVLEVIGGAKLWHRAGDYVFAHAGGTNGMFVEEPMALREAIRKKSGLMHRALYGQTDGTKNEEGFPTRLYDWIDRLPEGKKVVIGHDIRKQITYVNGAAGGQCIHIDTGAGKGGHLSWLDLSLTDLGAE